MGIKIFYLDVLFRGAKFFQNLLELKSVVKVSDIATINIIYCHPKLSTLKVYRILTKILFHPFRQSFLFPRKIKKKTKNLLHTLSHLDIKILDRPRTTIKPLAPHSSTPFSHLWKISIKLRFNLEKFPLTRRPLSLILPWQIDQAAIN